MRFELNFNFSELLKVLKSSKVLNKRKLFVMKSSHSIEESIFQTDGEIQISMSSVLSNALQIVFEKGFNFSFKSKNK